MRNTEWRPIEDLPGELKSDISSTLQVFAVSWETRRLELISSKKLNEFKQRLERQWAIETGIIERVYTLDRGVTQLLIEKGIEASLIPHGATNKPVSQVVSIIKDQKEVIDGLFDFVAQRRSLSTSYIKQMHQVFMRNQAFTEGLDGFGNYIEMEVIRGDWKKWPNNPRRADGLIHQHCPPEQVPSEMDRLIEMHLHHTQENVSPEIEAAWLHHRFTQIHPFQDGNGRMARALASLIFLRAGWFPLVITNDIRDQYIRVSEQADSGTLQPMIDLFAQRQIHSFRQALSISEDITLQKSIAVVIQQSVERLRQRRIPSMPINISEKLENYTQERLVNVSRELSIALRKIDDSYWASVVRNGEDNHYWFKGQIIQIAKQFDYYANFREHRAWVQLKIRESRIASALVSFHGLGYESSGIMAVSAFLEFRNVTENEESLPEGPYSICTDIFQFTYQDDPESVLVRFKPWLEEVILIWLEQWCKQL